MADIFPGPSLGECLQEVLALSFRVDGAITKGDLVYLRTNVFHGIAKVSRCTSVATPAIGMAKQSALGFGVEVISVCVIGVVKLKASGTITIGTHFYLLNDAGPYVVGSATVATGIVGSPLQTFADGDTGLIFLNCL